MIDKIQALPIASVKPEYVPFMVSGLTADLALRNVSIEFNLIQCAVFFTTIIII